MLPLGQKVQDKLEKLIDKHMESIGASKVSLSSISSQALWEKSGRLNAYGAELFRLSDRKDKALLLAPTHEEEITALVSRVASSYRDLPLRLYQIGRKYRDELRPRQGMLRSREFVMKDLYTFDSTTEAALDTYEKVRAAYSRLFDELKVSYLVAEASSGDIGGDLSHEYHLPSAIGEDVVVGCDSCSYVANEELAIAKPSSPPQENDGPAAAGKAMVWRGISKDRNTLINVWYPAVPNASPSDINTHAIKKIVPELDPSIENPAALWTAGLSKKLVNIVDQRLGPAFASASSSITSRPDVLPPRSGLNIASLPCEVVSTTQEGQPINALRIREGDSCAQCQTGKLKIQKAVELGHTFHLGTKYSEPLGATIQLPENTMAPIQMGCHGIGVSRIISAVAYHLADAKGLNWPRAIAPFDVAIVGVKKDSFGDAKQVYDRLVGELDATAGGIDAVYDDRLKDVGWKLNDADTVGYPVIVVLGNKWQTEQVCEVQCRRLSVKEHVPLDKLPAFVGSLLPRL